MKEMEISDLFMTVIIVLKPYTEKEVNGQTASCSDLHSALAALEEYVEVIAAKNPDEVIGRAIFSRQMASISKLRSGFLDFYSDALEKKRGGKLCLR